MKGIRYSSGPGKEHIEAVDPNMYALREDAVSGANRPQQCWIQVRTTSAASLESQGMTGL